MANAKSKKAPAKKVAKKAPAKKPLAKKAVKKVVVKKAVAKKAVKKVVAKKVTTKKPVAKKQVATKKVIKKVAQKTVAKKIIAKKPAVKTVAKAAVKAASKPALKQAPKAAAKVVEKEVSAPAAKQAPNRSHNRREVPVFVPQSAKEQKALYKVGNFVVYPTHGVGKIMAEETQMIGDIELRLLVINFEKDKMTLRVPMHRASAAGLRPISNADKMKEVYASLKSKAKTSRGMWSRRAQEYESKINSGNILLICEVVRDLHQNVDQSERSYSERMIYENALGRLMGEIAAAEGTDTKTAYDKLMKLLRAKVAAAAALKEAA